LRIIIDVFVKINSIEFIVTIDEFGALYFPLELILQNINQKVLLLLTV